jgi:hypothetical protein
MEEPVGVRALSVYEKQQAPRTVIYGSARGMVLLGFDGVSRPRTLPSGSIAKTNAEGTGKLMGNKLFCFHRKFSRLLRDGDTISRLPDNPAARLGTWYFSYNFL